ncbi:LeuA family protein [Candidatus Nitrosocosmicus arcticus]|uniref:(R)-citramalat synthase / 2-isopropylmalate synthase n=1 Tax=Candidatus Nitrosocosmicus arcticus TaxID=2035267 RepID=A0A557SVJ1_9ARCH|nr:2-isopropylmalate synthase [Candidatus Nitrosocosmicus arcticus]TVP40629.1 (R)-citramalat synthase / 2-isopropylmalate synthase [Candidatus Nitrosocosmicus arcticus]
MSLKTDDPNYFAHQYNDSEKDKKKIKILDSTLREGEQHPGVSFSIKQRIQIAWMLDSFGVDQIEISPIVSPDHHEATKIIMKQGLKADIVAHVRSIKSDVDKALDCDTNWVATYMGISDIHLLAKLRISREEAKQRALEVVDYIKSHGLKSRFTMEDASRTDPEFLLEMCREMNQRGIERISIPDTVGIMRPRGMYNLVKMVHDNIDNSKTSLDVHCHNDVGLALSNALSGCDGGADQIHTTIDGLGERTGIPTLAETAVALNLIYKSNNSFRLHLLKDLSRTISDYTRIAIHESKPLVGDSAYKHKAGTHLAAILRNPSAYEIIEPKQVGNRRKIVFGELSGKNGSAYLLSLLGLDSSKENAESLAKGLKELRMGDILELFLDEKLERKILNEDYVKTNKE